MDLAGKRVMVIGLGVSGLAAARLLASCGARLVMTDLRADPRPDLHGESGASDDSMPSGEIHLGSEDPAWLDGVDLVVTSPGVPPASRLLTEADRRRIADSERWGTYYACQPKVYAVANRRMTNSSDCAEGAERYAAAV